MQTIKSVYGKAAVLSFALMLACSIANAQCNSTVQNNSTCPTKFLSISSNKCSVSYSTWEEFTITVTVNQTGATYVAYPGGDCTIVRSSTSGTTLTYVVRKNSPNSTSAGLSVSMGGSCNQQNFAAIGINQTSPY